MVLAKRKSGFDMRMFSAALGFILFSTGLLAETRQPKIAVMEIEDTSQRFDAAIIENATEMLRSKLTATGRFVVIDKSRQQEKLKNLIKEEKRESYKECYDQKCQIPLGQALAADTILRSSISCISQNCVLSAELVDLAKEATIRGGSAEFIYNPDSPEALFPAIVEVIKQLTPEPPKPLEPPPVLPPKPLEPPKKIVIERSHPYLWWGLGTFLVGAGLIGGAIASDVKAADWYDRYRDMTSDAGIADWVANGGTQESFVKKANDALANGDDLRTISIALYVTGATAAVTGMTLMIWWKDTPVEQLTILPTPGGAMISFSGEF